MPPEVIGIDASRTSVTEKTGTEWYSFEIIHALADLDDRPALRLYERDSAALEDHPDVEHVRIELRRFWTHLGLDRELRNSHVDALFIPAHVIPRSHPSATVVTVHDLGYLHEPGAHTLERRLMLDLSTRWNARRAARIIVPSEATSYDLQREYGADPSCIDVIPHGLNHERFRLLPDREIERTIRELSIEQPYILFISTIQPRKNLSRLIAAFESRELNQFKLVVAGAAGWRSGPIINRMRLSARSEDIHWLGYVADEHIAALYNGASAYVLPSLYEGFGMGVIEAMACGCPVVVSSSSSLPEVAGDAAVIVDPYSVRDIRDGIVRALDGPIAEELRVRGPQRASEFTWERAARATLRSIRRAYGDCGG